MDVSKPLYHRPTDTEKFADLAALHRCFDAFVDEAKEHNTRFVLMFGIGARGETVSNWVGAVSVLELMGLHEILPNIVDEIGETIYPEDDDDGQK